MTDSTDKSIREYKETHILRNNPGMIRDCWLEQGANDLTILVIRQMKFDSNGSGAETKVIRLVGDEINALIQLIAASR